MLQARTWLPRAEGVVRLAFKTRGAATVLDTLHQAGAARARFPSPHEGGGEGQAQAILLNMAGGLTGGDRFDVDVHVQAGAAATVSTAAAEKIYRSRDGEPAQLRVSAHVDAQASLAWLPQPTILFDRSAFARHTHVELGPGATFLGAEGLIFGRAAMGERVESGSVRDVWRIRRDGRLVFADALRLDGSIARMLDRPAVLDGGHATAVLIYAAPGAPGRVEEIRTLLAPATSTVGVTAVNEILLLRAIAKDGRTLQADLRPAIEALSGRRMPRIWQC